MRLRSTFSLPVLLIVCAAIMSAVLVAQQATAVVAGTVFDIARIRQDVDLVTVRINYRWGGPIIAKY